MKKRSLPKQSAAPLLEALESRTLFSSATIAPGATAMAQPHSTVVAARSLKNAPTATSVAVSAGTIGQPITFTVTVRAATSKGSPVGSVNLISHGNVVETLTLSPTTSASARFAVSSASYVLTQPPGGPSYFFGPQAISAAFVPSGAFLKSSGSKIFIVSKPAYTGLANGVKYATVTPGSGPAIQSGQTASVLYTGYLASNGRIFDDSFNEGGAPFTFALGTGAVKTGFDEGTLGMQVGETRIVYVPPAEGFGAKKIGSVPGHSTLIYVLTLESIS